MNLANILTEEFVISFILLFIRFAVIFSMMPFYSHSSIPMKFKVSLAFLLTVMFHSSLETNNIPINSLAITLAIINEIVLAFCASLILNIIMYAIMYAGEQIAFTMGFSLASVIDPQTNMQVPVISKILSLIAFMVLISLDLHHNIIVFIIKLIEEVPLGGFYMSNNIYLYIVKAISNFFIIGFSIAFPITAISLLIDIIFGMLMKTMPQFNLLIIGFPIKIAFSFIVLVSVLGSIFIVFKKNFFEAFNHIGILFI